MCSWFFSMLHKVVTGKSTRELELIKHAKWETNGITHNPPLNEERLARRRLDSSDERVAPRTRAAFARAADALLNSPNAASCPAPYLSTSRIWSPVKSKVLTS